MNKDTIAAFATNPGKSGIGIIRISGDKAREVISSIFLNKKKEKLIYTVDSHTIRYGYIFNEKGEMLDEVMVSYMKGPKSFTAEDVVEINCHGGIFVMQLILQQVLKNGARLAEPGEFTKRAFLNGRIDLSSAEAVMDVISSENESALISSVSQLSGSLAEKIRSLREMIIYEIAFIESALDDPEHISLDGYEEELQEKINEILRRISDLLDSYEKGKVMKDGIKTVILGKANAGKSSLLNLLAGEDLAIVTDIPGTTRDVLKEQIRLHNLTLHIADTAGIRNTDDPIEKIGVERAKKLADEADVILYMVDASVPLNEYDFEIMNFIQNKKCIILLNKTDLFTVVTKEDQKLNSLNKVIIHTSVKKEKGIKELEEELQKMFLSGKISSSEVIYITNERHRESLFYAQKSILEVQKSLELGMTEDFLTSDLMDAYENLGRIIGETTDDDLVNEIFTKFCMGK